ARDENECSETVSADRPIGTTWNHLLWVSQVVKAVRRSGRGRADFASSPGNRLPGLGMLPPVSRSGKSALQKKTGTVRPGEIDDKPPGSFRKKSARGCMFMGNKQIKEIRFGKLGGSQSLFLSS